MGKFEELQEMVFRRFIKDEERLKAALETLQFFRSPDSEKVSPLISLAKFKYPIDYGVASMMSILNMIYDEHAPRVREVTEDDLEELDNILHDALKHDHVLTDEDADRLGKFLYGIINDH